MDLFTQIIYDLSELIDVNLSISSNRVCAFKVNQALHIQLKEERSDILLSCFLGQLLPGKLRENILKEALKANQREYDHGILCYSVRNDQLALFLHVELDNLSGELLADILDIFLKKAFSWKEAVETGQIPFFPDAHSFSIFDLKH